MITVVHIGARGNPVKEWLPIAKRVALHGIDASNQAVEKLSNLDKLLGFQAFYKYAITGTGGKRQFNCTKSPDCSSFLEPDLVTWGALGSTDRARVVKTETLDTITLNEFENKHLDRRIDFLKLDVQGLEHEILSSYTRLDRILGIEVEAMFVPLYKEQKLFYDLARLLYPYGLSLYGMRRCSWSNDSFKRMVFADCLFLRDKDVPNYHHLLKKYGLISNKEKRKWDARYTSF
jgi:FkbM family methyltransferase